ncbi:hypothetical protein ACQVP2_08255 [Methylobacterium aquaticum]|uniref:hypothetical protein n=1 Tax=Methylobacterium aquaticum TaxID=270351 RepID=UPI003D162CA1
MQHAAPSDLASRRCGGNDARSDVQAMIRLRSMMFVAAVFSASAARSEEWPKSRGCTFKLGSGRDSIKAGDKFTTPRGYIFIRASDLAAWKSERENSRSGQITSRIPVEKATGVIRVTADTVMIANEFMDVCFGDVFEGAAKHPEFRDVYIVNIPNF